MAQILKHRRGSINSLKDVTARTGEIVVATGSIGDMNGPWVFIGNDELAGGYRPISKIYEGSNVPTISAGSYGTILDGTPFYSTTNESLYVLSASGNRKLDLSGNLESHVVTNLTITNLSGSFINVPNITGNIGIFMSTLSSSYLDVRNDLIVSGSTQFVGDITGSNFRFTGDGYVNGDMNINGNLNLLGSATYLHISSSTIELDDNIIRLNAYSPFERYAGIEVIDSGSSSTSASLLWDSLNDYWLFISSSGLSSRLVGTTNNTYGNEISLTTGSIPISTGPNTLGDSLLTFSGTTLLYNTNKFTIDSNDGSTLISGGVTLSFSGGTDNGSKTSSIVFKNSSNVLGYVSTTETTDIMDGILGYKNSNGNLVFSTIIDGGTY